jgi:hypothetical protein
MPTLDELHPRLVCEATGCRNVARVALRDDDGQRLGHYCRACGHRKLLRALKLARRLARAERTD